MDSIDEKLLNLLQEGIALESRPFKIISEKLFITESEVVNRINNLKESHYIRKFGGIFDSRKLGYTGTLCGITVSLDRLEEVAKIINSYDEVTHNYLRDHKYNMWFTVLSSSEDELQNILNEISAKTEIADIVNLPAKKLFKVRTTFKVGGDANAG